MPTVKAGYPTTTTALQTASGKESAARALDPKNATVILDDKTEISVVDAVTKYVLHDTEEKSAKEAKEKDALVLRTYAGTVRDDNALAGDYQKTLRILGKAIKGSQYAVDAAQVDKFSVPKSKADMDALKKILGKNFDTIFEPTVEISIKKSVMENDALRKELSLELFKTLGADGIKKFFDKEETFKVKKGMAEDQYGLDKTVREAIRTHVKQANDMLKDATGPEVQ